MQRRRRAIASGLILSVVASFLLITASPAQALDVTVRFTITDIVALDSLEEPGAADFYAIVTIDGTERVSNPCAPGFEDDDTPLEGPASLEFKKEGINLSVGTIAIKVELLDDDDPCPDDFINWGSLRGDDDSADITPDGSRDLDITLNLGTCTFTGESNNSCGVEVQTAGTSGDDNASMTFKVEVDEPPSAPGQNIRCWHTPIAPNPGDAVTIRVEYLDGALAADVKIADLIQVFLGFDKVNAAGSTTGAEEFTHTVPGNQINAPNFTYACRLVDDGSPIWTGWRTVNVGPAPEPGGPLPIMQTGPQQSRIDVVFVADMDNYTGPLDNTAPGQFLNDVSTMVRQAYFGDGPYSGTDVAANATNLLTNQDTFNFWLAGSLGDAEPSEAGCPHQPPNSWDELHAFADVGGILHTDVFRDCAPFESRLFSAEAVSANANSYLTFRHEQGHTPFGLADEYCNTRPGSTSMVCDGGYFQTEERPNVFAPGTACEADAVSFGLPPTCQSWTSTRSGGGSWETHEPVNGDLMVNNTTPQNADNRRINFILDTACASADC